MSRLTYKAKYRFYKTEGADLGYKGARSSSPKALTPEQIATSPGANGTSRQKKSSDYGIQLRAKQKAKRLYIVTEKQFKNYYLKAKAKTGQTGDNLLSFLESRLDNVVYKSGLSLSKDHSRQLVSHCHILVNGKVVNIPSYQVKANDQITLIPKIAKNDKLTLRFQSPDFNLPSWLTLDKAQASAKITGLPDLTDVKNQINVNLIVEYYSR